MRPALNLIIGNWKLVEVGEEGVGGEFSSHLSSRGYVHLRYEGGDFIKLARSTKSFEVPLFSEFAKQVVAHNPDIAESGKPMDEKKFTEEKICYKANAHPACILSLQSIERRSKLEKAIDVDCKAQQISVNLDHRET